MSTYLALNGFEATLVHDADEQVAAGRHDEALDTASRVRLAPADARALVVRARALTGRGDVRAADAAWAAAARRDPNTWQIHYEWAIALNRAGRTERARKQYARARQLNPRLPAR